MSLLNKDDREASIQKELDELSKKVIREVVDNAMNEVYLPMIQQIITSSMTRLLVDVCNKIGDLEHKVEELRNYRDGHYWIDNKVFELDNEVRALSHLKDINAYN